MSDSNQKPLVPNFVPRVGRLATDRYDFEAHIDGSKFRHTADEIDLSPPVIIGGVTITTTQGAIATLSDFVSPTIPQATTISTGVVQLSGDVQGTATNLTVFGIRGRPISNLPPVSGNVLTWDGSMWGPQGLNGLVTFSQDLSGSLVAQSVVGLTGNNLGTVNISANTFQFNSTVSNPTILQAPISGQNGQTMTIAAQDCSSGSGTGGDINLQGGRGRGAIAGGVSLIINGSIDDVGQYIFEATEVPRITPDGNRVIGLLPFNTNSGLRDSDMPFNTGSRVVYLGQSTLPPTIGSPTGSILWSDGNGEINITQSTGTNVTLGNPIIINAVPSTSIPTVNLPNSGTVSYTVSATSPSSDTPVNVINFTIPINTLARFNVIWMGKSFTNKDSAVYTADTSASSPAVPGGVSWVTDSSTLSTVGFTNVNTESVHAGAGSWGPPGFVAASPNFNSIAINTGSFTYNIHWTVIVTVTLITA